MGGFVDSINLSKNVIFTYWHASLLRVPTGTSQIRKLIFSIRMLFWFILLALVKVQYIICWKQQKNDYIFCFLYVMVCQPGQFPILARIFNTTEHKMPWTHAKRVWGLQQKLLNAAQAMTRHWKENQSHSINPNM